MFLRAIWHSLKVISVAGYWMLTIYFIWGGLAALGSNPTVGWSLIALVAALFAVRVYIGGRYVPVATAYVMAFSAYMAVLMVIFSLA